MKKAMRTLGRAALTGGLLLGAGCRQFDSADYSAVCDGRAVAKAPPYQPDQAPGGDYPVFTALKEPSFPRWRWNQALLWPSLADAGVKAPSAQTHERIQLVLCVEQQPGDYAGECPIEDVVLRLHHGRMRAELREARTGRVVATRNFEVRNEECPTTVLVSFSEKEPRRYPPPEAYQAELSAFLAPHLPPDIRKRLPASPAK